EGLRSPQPLDSHVAHVVAQRDLAGRLTLIQARNGFTPLVRRQLRLGSELNAARLGPLTALVRPIEDQTSLEGRNAAQHSQKQFAMRRGGVEPRVVQRLECSAGFFDPIQNVQKVAGRSGQPIDLGHQNDVAWLQALQEPLCSTSDRSSAWIIATSLS